MEKDRKYALLDMQVSAKGRYAAITAGYETAPGENQTILMVFDLENKKTACEHREISITHMEWHPAMEKLLFISILTGLNSLDFSIKPTGELLEGIVKHSVIFLDSFKFSPSGSGASYLLHNTALKRELTSIGDLTDVKTIFYKEEESQLLFYEMGDISGKIINLGRAWAWLDENQIIFTRSGEILVKNIVNEEIKKITKHNSFILDFIPLENKVFLLSLGFEEFEFPDEGYRIFSLDIDSGEIEPVDPGGEFSPRIKAHGGKLLLEMYRGNSHWISCYFPGEKKNQAITGIEGFKILPCGVGEDIYYLESSEESPVICRICQGSSTGEILIPLKELFYSP